MSSENTSAPKRSYQKRRRAERELETRRRITEAAVKLHGTLGPARTTIKGIATEAGVQRATVYRHFPDLNSLFITCSTHWANLNPPPDPNTWTQITDPDIRLRQGLSELYAWYGWAEPMLNNVFRDAPSVPAMTQTVEDFQRHFQALHQALMSRRRVSGRARARTAAAIGHALAFGTWHSLVREHELDPGEAVALMSGLVASAPWQAASIANRP
ncbi:MAG TPA: TetR/AcrR family transcriptional regulator [Solirubrobacteraceae bacterium]|nr:TetR/AcrR family transcriptional regulator [Solirubrobacteraceae bacterium]